MVVVMVMVMVMVMVVAVAVVVVDRWGEEQYAGRPIEED